MRAALLLGLALAGCGRGGGAPAAPLEVAAGCRLAAAPGLMEGTIEVDGVTRRYLVAVPAGYQPDRRHALVFGWHGRYSSPAYAHASFGVEEAAGEAAVVYPAGLPISDDPQDTGWDLDPAGIDLALCDALIAVVAGEGEASRAHWTAAGACHDTVQPVAGHPPCVAHDGCEPPVWWCLHDQAGTDGHVWPAWAGAAASTLFTTIR